MTSQEEKTQIQCRKLTDNHTTESLVVLSDCVATSMGPHGGIKILGNACGGHLSLTTLSNRLLNTLTPDCPLTKLILTAANQHVQSYGDAGLFMTRVTLNLVTNGLRSRIDPKLLIKSNSAMLQLLLDYLASAGFPCKTLVDISDVKAWTCVASTMLLAKPLCELDAKEADMIAQLLLEAFVVKLPSMESGLMSTLGDVHIVGVSGRSSDQSFCCRGLLLELSDLSEVKDWLENHHSNEDSISAIVKTIVVNISMSGDSDEFLRVTFEGNRLENLEEMFLGFIEDFCHQLTVLGVQVVFCQKVIHPRIKELLRTKDILAIERLGSEFCPKVLSVTGARPASSFSDRVTTDQIGCINHLSIMNVSSHKSFLHIKQTNSPSTLATVVLFSYMDEQLEELKAISNNILNVFGHLLRNPSILYGGGCWQFCVSNFLREKIKLEKEHLSEELQCLSYQLLKACEYFCRSLEQSCVPQASSGLKCYTHTSLAGHLWVVDKQLDTNDPDTQPYSTLSCMCGTRKSHLPELNPLPEEYFTFGYGMQNLSSEDSSSNTTLILQPEKSELKNCDSTDKPLLMDCFIPWKNSLETSIKMANMALSTNQFIYETAHLI